MIAGEDGCDGVRGFSIDQVLMCFLWFWTWEWLGDGLETRPGNEKAIEDRSQ
jgi:hypothetical protein